MSKQSAIKNGEPKTATQPALSQQEILRYSRHLIMPEVGMDGQLKLKQAKVLLIGTGGLGAPLGLYLAAAGVGRLGLVDFDVVDFTNLQRQVTFGTKDVGRPKLEAAAERLRDLNPEIEIVLHEAKLSSENALDILRGYDIVADGTDNFPTRYLVNDACVLLGKPNVYGSIFRFEGQATVFALKDGPCYRCLYPEPPPPGLVPSCAEGGVLGVLPGIVAMIQATETIKLVTGVGEPLIGRLLQYSALDMTFSEFQLRKDPACPVCGESPSVTALIDYDQFCAPRPEEAEAPVPETSAARVAARRAAGEDFLLLDVRDAHELEIARIAGSTWIPLGELERRAGELADWKERPIVVHCKTGGRSARACRILAGLGFRDVVNLAGGIDRWSETVDPGVPRY